MIGFRKIKHPPQAALMDHAEGLVGFTARLVPDVVAHVAICPQCQSRVDEMKADIRLINQLDSVEPSSEFSSSVLLAARKVRGRRRTTASFLKTSAVAASLALFAAVLPTYVMQPEQMKSFDAIEQTVTEVTKAELFVMPISGKASPEETLLAPAVQGAHRSPGSDWERAQHRALEAYDSDIAEAELALASNRALTRAYVLIDQSRARKARTLKDVYTESH